MRIPFLIHQGQFRLVIQDAIQNAEGKFPVTVQLQTGGGYSGSIRVEITEASPREFHSDWEGTDPTRFPARIRAAATALRDTKQLGTFLITHKDGEICISAVPHGARP